MSIRDLGAAGDVPTISYSEFRQKFQNDNVTTVTVQGEEISGTFDQPLRAVQG